MQSQLTRFWGEQVQEVRRRQCERDRDRDRDEPGDEGRDKREREESRTGRGSERRWRTSDAARATWELYTPFAAQLATEDPCPCLQQRVSCHVDLAIQMQVKCVSNKNERYLFTLFRCTGSCKDAGSDLNVSLVRNPRREGRRTRESCRRRDSSCVIP